MKLILPKRLDKFSHDEIVKTLIELNPRFYHPNRGSWQQNVPDLEDPSREVVKVALIKLRDAWTQCLYYNRSGATRIHLVLSPRQYLDYKTKESKISSIPNVEVYTLPELLIKSYLLPKKRKTKEETKKHPIANIEPIMWMPTIVEEPELEGNIDLEKYWAKHKPKELQQVYTEKHCVDCKKFKEENNMGVCPKYNWEIALDLTERDAVCVGG